MMYSSRRFPYLIDCKQRDNLSSPKLLDNINSKNAKLSGSCLPTTYYSQREANSEISYEISPANGMHTIYHITST